MPTTSITLDETPLVLHLLRRADDALILGHRLSEWTGHAPTLEEELALANIALDLIGQARLLYAHAGSLTGHDEDQLAYLRDARAWRNLLLVELPNGDFAQTILRIVLFSAFMQPCWQATTRSTEATLAAIAAKAEKEVAYHLRHGAEWLIRLGDGTAGEPPPFRGRPGRALAVHGRTVRDRRTPSKRSSPPASLPIPSHCAQPGRRRSTTCWPAPP